MSKTQASSIFRRGALLAFAAVAVLSATAAQAGVFKAALEHAVAKAAEGKGIVRVPGREGPMAPGSDEGFSACPQLFPGNSPINVSAIESKWKAVGLCSNHFAVVHSSLTKTPMVVVEKLSSALLADAQGEERTNDFYPDSRLHRGQRAELADYARSGYDRGHLANAADQPDQQAMIQSFALSNMVPQDPTNNRKVWSKIESDVRKYVRRAKGDVFVFSGPLYLDGPAKTIGAGRVWVPSHLFKLVYDQAGGRSWAYILPNTADARIERPMEYAEFVQRAGWRLLNSAAN